MEKERSIDQEIVGKGKKFRFRRHKEWKEV